MSSVFSSCDFIAGWASGILALVVGHPLDTIKVWSQTLPEKSSSLTIISTIYKIDGVRGYYKGMMFPLLTAGALNSLFFGVYGNSLRQMQSHRGVEQTMCWFQEKPYPQWYWDILCAGCFGGFVCSLVTCPVELIKTQMQTQTGTGEVKGFYRTHKFKNPWECFLYQFKTNGIKGLYKGWVPLLWRDVPASGIYMLVYTHSCEQLSDKEQWAIMLAGANAAAMISSALLTALACVCVVGTKASHYPSAPQYTWAPRQAVPHTSAPSQQRAQQYYKGQATGYNSAPGFWYGGSSKGDTWNYNRLPTSGGYAAGFYKNDRVDRPSYPSGSLALGTTSTTEGRVSGKALDAGGYSRFTTNYQDPQHNRYGGFTLPPQNPQAYGSYGSYRNVGFYGAKGPSGPGYPLSRGPPPVNLQAFRGSKIYEGPVGLKYNQTKKTGVYVIPTPSKLYYDGVKN